MTDPKPEEKYTLISVLGSGTYGTAWLAKDDKDNNVVIKIIKKLKLPNIHFDNMISREHIIPLALQKGQCQENISCLIEFLELSKFYWIVSEYIPGKDMDKWVQDTNLQKDINVKLKIAYELAKGFKYIHSQGVAHRDIKPENVIISDAHPYIIDFGLSCLLALDDFAKTIPQAEKALCKISNIQNGTPLYMAPELFRPKPDPLFEPLPNLFMADVYSLGVLFYEFFNNGEMPVKLTNRASLKMEKFQRHKKSHSGSDIDPLIDRMLDISPAKRPTMKEIKESIEDILILPKTKIDWDQTHYVFNEYMTKNFIPEYDQIPIFDQYSAQKFSSTKFNKISKEFLAFQPDFYEYNYEMASSYHDTFCALVKSWSNHNFKLEFWSAKNGYAVIFSGKDYFLVFGDFDGAKFVISPEINFSIAKDLTDADYPSFQLENIKGLAGENLAIKILF